jgi:glycosyltransferase involved in cell wall biosynthesis
MQRLQLRENTSMKSDQADAQSDLPFALFFARIEAYKGVDILIKAVRQIEAMAHQASSPASELPPLRVVIAGEGNLPQSTAERLPGNVEIRNRLIKDDEATVLFRNCSVVVLPYIDATQSALIASAYFRQASHCYANGSPPRVRYQRRNRLGDRAAKSTSIS